METKRLMFMFLCGLLFQLIRIDASSPLQYFDTSCESFYFEYTNNSIFEQNLDNLLSSLPPKASLANFYNTTMGESTGTVYGLFQCRQDLSLDVCNDCIQNATEHIKSDCSFSGEAVIWYYECMLRYSSRNIFSLSEVETWASRNSSDNVTSFTNFSTALGITMEGVIRESAVNSSSGHFATRESNLSLSGKLYSLAQCTPDIDTFGCNRCLRTALALINSVCRQGCSWAMAFYPSCQLRYDLKPFYNESALLAVQPPMNSPSSSGSGLKTGAVVGIAIAAAVGLLLLIGGIWLCWRKRKAKQVDGLLTVTSEARSIELQHQTNSDGANNVGDIDFMQYGFATLSTAAKDFSDDNKLGEGGFGSVYKGVLKTGEIIAIKRLSGNSGQGVKEFMTEARIVAQLQHRNLVKIIGVCSEGYEKLLVYEFMPNTSLDRFLFDPKKRAFLEWNIRYKIILGIARGLQYLHEDSRLTIIHRDLKTSNILLDGDMSAKIADFGMAKLFRGEQDIGKTSSIVGTYGYMAPEYLLQGEYSNKSDVYSFGIIVLEILSGQKNRVSYQTPQREDLPIYTWSLWKAGKILEILDPVLLHSSSTNEVLRCAEIGLLCVQRNPADRPTMGRVVLMLNGLIALPTPSSPAMPSHDFGAPMDIVPPSSSEQSTTKTVTWRTTELEEDLYPR